MRNKPTDRLEDALQKTEREMHELIGKLNTQPYDGVYAQLDDAERVGELAQNARKMRDAMHLINAVEIAAKKKLEKKKEKSDADAG